MIDRLSLQRFTDLALAYGGVIERWPVADQAAARDLAQTVEGAAVLADARALDQTLDAWRLALPDARLAARIAASGARTPKWRAQAGLWWSGLGVAAALAGAVAGFAAVTLAGPGDTAPADTSFGNVAEQDS